MGSIVTQLSNSILCKAGKSVKERGICYCSLLDFGVVDFSGHCDF